MSSPSPLRVASGVYAVPHSVVEGLNGVICDADEVVVIDTGHTAEDGRRLRGFVDSFQPRRLVVVYTHGHADHVLGSGSFLDATVVTTKQTADQMDRLVAVWARERRLRVAELRPLISWPSVRLLADAELRVGRRHVTLLAVPGHTPGSLVAFLPDPGILFGGDTIVTAIPPSIADGDNRDLEVSLRRLADLDARFLVPGHGRPIRGRKVIREGLFSTADYIASIREAVQELLNTGHEHSAIVDQLPFERFAHSAVLPDFHDTPSRHRSLVRDVLRDEVARLGRSRRATNMMDRKTESSA